MFGIASRNEHVEGVHASREEHTDQRAVFIAGRLGGGDRASESEVEQRVEQWQRAHRRAGRAF